MNPKDAVGSKKPPMSCVPLNVVQEVAIALHEGALKYGRFNWRETGVRPSVYMDATLRHLFAWYEGEDLDPDSGISHVTKAIASMIVLRDAMLSDMLVEDDRPKPGGRAPLQQQMDALMERLA